MTAFITLLVFLLLQVCVESQPPKATKCYSGVYILLPPPHGVTTPALQQTLVNNVTAAIPGSHLHVVPYDTNANFSVGVAQGQMLLNQEIRRYYRRCPSSPVVLMGYSEGGIIVMNSLCGNLAGTGRLQTKYAPNIVAAIAYGEETFVPGQSYDQGTCVAPGHSENPRPNPALCDPFAASIHSYCDAPDPYCCNGTDEPAHFEYPNYDVVATQFVVQQYNAFIQSH